MRHPYDNKMPAGNSEPFFINPKELASTAQPLILWKRMQGFLARSIIWLQCLLKAFYALLHDGA
jgi:hypothetical protein